MRQGPVDVAASGEKHLQKHGKNDQTKQGLDAFDEKSDAKVGKLDAHQDKCRKQQIRLPVVAQKDDCHKIETEHQLASGIHSVNQRITVDVAPKQKLIHLKNPLLSCLPRSAPILFSSAEANQISSRLPSVFRQTWSSEADRGDVL